MKKRTIGAMIGAILLSAVLGTSVQALDFTGEDAAAMALENAGVAESDVIVYKVMWEFNNGRDQYDISFLIPGQTKYEYEIDMETQKILKSDTEAWDADDDLEYAGLKADANTDPDESVKALGKAIETALADAGVNGSDAVIYQSGSDFENGKHVFVVSFFLTGQTKYEYDIDAETGAVLARDQERWEADDDLEYEALLNPGSRSDAGAADASGALTDTDAAAIAIKDAGFSESDVTVTECRKELDDGIEKFSVTFRTADGAEYEYDIDAASGSILEKDMEYDD